MEIKKKIIAKKLIRLLLFCCDNQKQTNEVKERLKNIEIKTKK